MSEFLNQFFDGVLIGAILYSASMVVKTIYKTNVEKVRERVEKEWAEKARDQKIISLLEENLSQLKK